MSRSRLRGTILLFSERGTNQNVNFKPCVKTGFVVYPNSKPRDKYRHPLTPICKNPIIL